MLCMRIRVEKMTLVWLLLGSLLVVLIILWLAGVFNNNNIDL